MRVNTTLTRIYWYIAYTTSTTIQQSYDSCRNFFSPTGLPPDREPSLRPPPGTLQGPSGAPFRDLLDPRTGYHRPIDEPYTAVHPLSLPLIDSYYSTNNTHIITAFLLFKRVTVLCTIPGRTPTGDPDLGQGSDFGKMSICIYRGP